MTTLEDNTYRLKAWAMDRQHWVHCDAEWGWLNYVASYVLGPLYGLPCGMYRLHHKVMHHVVSYTVPAQSGGANHCILEKGGGLS